MQLEAEEVTLKGSPICRGIAIGKPFFLNRNEINIHELQAKPEQEIERYRHALLRVRQDIKRLLKQLEAESADEAVQILEAQLAMLQDPLLTIEIEETIFQTEKNAEFILQQSIEKFETYFKSLNDAFFQERFKDIEDLSRRIFGYLNENGCFSLKNVPQNSIVCAQELTATDAAEAEANRVSAFLTESGGPTSHAAIVAKSKGIPLISNLDIHALKESLPQKIIVDGRTGLIFLNPSKKKLEEFTLLKNAIYSQNKNFKKIIHLPAETYDGYSMRLHANVDMPQEIRLIHDLGGQGIGLFRSEYLFLLKEKVPTEEEQCEIYKKIIDEMQGMPVVIRTFDLGGDKSSFYPPSQTELPGLLEGKGTRFLQKEPYLLRSQLRAILRASERGNVHILFPMIATLTELKIAKRVLKEVREELGLYHPIRIGCMIEVPSAALLADQIAAESDFLSIGTNDLLQYTLAVDRGDQTLSEIYEPCDPSLLRLIKIITTEANKAKIPVSVCGEIAADPRYTSLLMGLGVQELSVAPRYLPMIKNTIRKTSIVEAVQLADRLLDMKTTQEVKGHLSEFYRKNVPLDLYFSEGVLEM